MRPGISQRPSVDDLGLRAGEGGLDGGDGFAVDEDIGGPVSRFSKRACLMVSCSRLFKNNVMVVFAVDLPCLPLASRYKRAIRTAMPRRPVRG